MKVGRMLALVVAVVGIGVVAGCGSGSSSSSSPAGDAAKQQMELLINRQFAEQYDNIHPAQQATMTKDGWVKCATTEFGSLPPGTTVSVKSTTNEKADVPNTMATGQDAVAVTLTLQSGSEAQEVTLDVFNVDGKYRLGVPASTMSHCLGTLGQN